ncbi:uncharacterized, partial [Tachysurus ichikawai]
WRGEDQEGRCGVKEEEAEGCNEVAKQMPGQLKGWGNVTNAVNLSELLQSPFFSKDIHLCLKGPSRDPMRLRHSVTQTP